MNKHILALLLAASAGMAHAADKVCVIESTGEVEGKTVETMDCVENISQKKEIFKENCNNNLKLGALFKRKTKVTFMDACPRPTQGICENGAFMQTSHYFYKKSPKEIKTIKETCGGGVTGNWSDG